jgi:hypothetical protein
MLRSLSESLRRVVETGFADETDVTFDRPADALAPQRPAINLFLFDVQENAEYRTAEPVVERAGGRVRVGPPPVYVDCQYLVTAWPNAADAAALREHELLGRALAVLAPLGAIPAAALQGELRAAGAHVRLRVGWPTRVRTFGEFWTAVGAKARPAFALTATAPVPPPAPAAADVVLGHEVRLGTRPPGENPVTLVHVAGRVVTAAGAAVGGARVVLAALGREAVTAADGAFRFDALPPGEHAARVVTGAADESVTLVVPAPPGPDPYTLRLS